MTLLLLDDAGIPEVVFTTVLGLVDLDDAFTAALFLAAMSLDAPLTPAPVPTPPVAMPDVLAIINDFFFFLELPFFMPITIPPDFFMMDGDGEKNGRVRCVGGSLECLVLGFGVRFGGCSAGWFSQEEAEKYKYFDPFFTLKYTNRSEIQECLALQ